jgi:hypothetical protein
MLTFGDLAILLDLRVRKISQVRGDIPSILPTGINYGMDLSGDGGYPKKPTIVPQSMGIYNPSIHHFMGISMILWKYHGHFYGHIMKYHETRTFCVSCLSELGELKPKNRQFMGIDHSPAHFTANLSQVGFVYYM